MVHIPPKPKSDAEFLGVVAQIIFVAGFKWSLVHQRWPKMKKAFHNFNVEKLSKEKMENLIQKEGMIKNKGKILAVIENAKLCKDLRKEHGSVMKWVAKVQKQHKKDPLFNPTPREEMKRFVRIGNTTSRWLAYVATRDKTLLEQGEK